MKLFFVASMTTMIAFSVSLAQQSVNEVAESAFTTLPVGYSGYCPVNARQNIESFLKKNPDGKPSHADVFTQKGHAEFCRIYDGVIYYFADFESLSKFEKDPFPFVPVLGGNCVTCYKDQGAQIVRGSKNFFVFEKDGRFYLFPNQQTKSDFLPNFKRYLNVDLQHPEEILTYDKDNEAFLVVDESDDSSPKYFHLNNLVYRFDNDASLQKFKEDPDLRRIQPKNK